MIYPSQNRSEEPRLTPRAFVSGSPPFNSSIASFNSWLRGFLPSFSDRNIQRVETLYSATGSSEGIASYNTTYTRAGLIYRDLVLACPAYWMSRAAHKKSYVGEYMISPAKHASDTEWVCVFVPSYMNILTNAKKVEPSKPNPNIPTVHIRRLHRRLCFLLPDRRSECT